MSPDQRDAPEVHGLDPWGLNQVEQLLLGLSGVNSLKLVPNGHGGIDEVHVVGTQDLGAKQIVRNIESALLAEFGLQIDHRKISVAQVEEPDIHPAAEDEASDAATEAGAGEASARTLDALSAGTRRLLLDKLEIDRRAGHRVACRVTLRDGETTYEGESEGPDFSRSRLDVAGRAVLEALNDATLDEITLRLEGVTRVEIVERDLVVVVVQGQENRRTVTLPGVSVVDDSPEEAAVLACLQATNRWASAA
jgi:hypothetical protein